MRSSPCDRNLRFFLTFPARPRASHRRIAPDPFLLDEVVVTFAFRAEVVACGWLDEAVAFVPLVDDVQRFQVPAVAPFRAEEGDLVVP